MRVETLLAIVGDGEVQVRDVGHALQRLGVPTRRAEWAMSQAEDFGYLTFVGYGFVRLTERGRARLTK
jgi:Mn-dependent DtxR family transcriptional regulator